MSCFGRGTFTSSAPAFTHESDVGCSARAADAIEQLSTLLAAVLTTMRFAHLAGNSSGPMACARVVALWGVLLVLVPTGDAFSGRAASDEGRTAKRKAHVSDPIPEEGVERGAGDRDTSPRAKGSRKAAG